MKNMRVAQAEFEFVDSASGHENRDWKLSTQYATFHHRDDDACEFIFYLGNSREETNAKVLLSYSKLGFSNEFLTECLKAIKKGYNYICFYA